MRFDALGTWRLRYWLGGQLLADAPLTVVATAKQLRNRRPSPVTVSLATPDVSVCTVATSLVIRDPDYDVVRYRYRWTAGGKVLRSVTSAALTDVLMRGAAKPGQRLTCAVTPSDGRLSGKTATVSAQLR